MTASTSLQIGSDALGWHELGGKAVLGQMTKAMPGGDGSLEFALYGDDAWKARNVLVAGEAEVKLVVGGEPVYGGVLVTDPVRHRLSCQSVVECAASGPYGLAARDGRYGYIGIDTDPEQWRRRQFGDGSGEWDFHPGRFTVKTDGVFEIRAESDRAYEAFDVVHLYFWMHEGLVPGAFISGISFEYQCSLNSDWLASISHTDEPSNSTWYTGWSRGSGVVTSWTPASFSVAHSVGSQVAALDLTAQTDLAAGGGRIDRFIRVRNVRLHGRWSDGGLTTADTSVSIGDVLTDLAAELSVTNTRIHASLSSFALDQFVARYPTDVAEVMRQALALYTGPVEAFFDLDPVTLTRRFTARPRPADTALAAENRLWVVGGRGGEDTSGLVRDWEATPDQIEAMYAVKDHATLPDGTVQAVRYPGGAEPSYPLAEVVDLTSDKPTMTATDAARYAQAVYDYRQSNRYSGDVAVMQTAHDEHGADVPTYKLRPGDRLTALDRDDTDRFGETLYVQATSYDWSSNKGTATVGSPFDPAEFAFAAGGGGGGGRSAIPGHALPLGAPSRPRPHIRKGIA